jgi:hypothetical protein
MASLTLLFSVTKDDDLNGFMLYSYIAPDKIKKEVSEKFDLLAHKQYLFSFSEFNNFSNEYYGKAIHFFFDNMIRNIKEQDNAEARAIPEETMVFQFETEINLDKDQLLILLCVCNNLQLFNYTSAIINLLMDEHKLTFEIIDQHCSITAKEYAISIHTK